MGLMRPWLAAAGGVMHRDLIVLASYRAAFFSRLLSVLFTLVTFYYISQLVQIGEFERMDYFAYVVVGIFILQALTSTLVAGPAAVRQELVAGTFERFIVSPFGAVSGVLSVLIFPTLLALLLGTIMIAVAGLFFGLPLEPGTLPLAFPVALLGAVAFAPFALVFIAAVVAFKYALGGSQFVVAAMAIIGGLYFPVALLPDWVEPLQHVQPFTPAADLLRHLIGGAPIDDPWLAVVKLVVFAAVLTPLAIWLLRIAVRRGQSRGTILEY
jgi:ABC-2 type transport system permease protein